MYHPIEFFLLFANGFQRNEWRRFTSRVVRNVRVKYITQEGDFVFGPIFNQTGLNVIERIYTLDELAQRKIAHDSHFVDDVLIDYLCFNFNFIIIYVPSFN